MPLENTGVLLPCPDSSSDDLDAHDAFVYNGIKQLIPKPPPKFPVSCSPEVSREAFIALVLGQAAINTTKDKMFPYGSCNQIDSLNKPETGASTLPRLMIAQGFPNFLKSAANMKQDEAAQLDSSALMAHYYGSANCPENSTATYAWLSTFAPPGYTISQVSAHPNLDAHAYALVWWKEHEATGKVKWCGNPVVVDPGFSPQVCLFSHFAYNPAHYKDNVSPEAARNPYRLHRSYTVPDDEREIFFTSRRKGFHKDIGDFLGQAASQLPASLVKLFPSKSCIADIPPQKLEQYKKDGKIDPLYAEFHDNFSYLNRYFQENGQYISSHNLGYNFSEDKFEIYNDKALLGPHVGKFINYCYKEKIRDNSGTASEKTHRLSDFGSDPSKKWKGAFVDGEREIWTAELPPSLLIDSTTKGTLVACSEERFRGKAGYRFHMNSESSKAASERGNYR